MNQNILILKNMKLLILVLAILGTSFAHEFFAEENFICRLCTESMKLISQEKFTTLKKLLEPYPAA